MTVLLVLAIFGFFITVDYIRKEKATQKTTFAQSKSESVENTGPAPNYVAGFALPTSQRYHPGHTWALEESPSLVRVGLDDFAARLIGKIDSIRLPKRGQWIRQGQKLATIVRDGETAQLLSPIEGEVTNINEALLTRSSLACSDPYGKGWLLSVFSPDATTNFRNLLNGGVARRWMAEAASRLQAKLPAMAGAVAQDGGIAIPDMTAELSGKRWSEITQEFFLT